MSLAGIIFILSPIYMLTYISLSSSESLAFCLKGSWQLLLSSADPSLLWRWRRPTSLPGRAACPGEQLSPWQAPLHQELLEPRRVWSEQVQTCTLSITSACQPRAPHPNPAKDKIISNILSVRGGTGCSACHGLRLVLKSLSKRFFCTSEAVKAFLCELC